MTVPIDVGAALIFLVSAAVGYAVYRHTKTVSITTPPTGDIGTAFTAASATLIALAFLFGIPTPTTEPEPTPPATGQPAPLSSTP